LLPVNGSFLVGDPVDASYDHLGLKAQEGEAHVRDAIPGKEEPSQ